MHKTETFEKDEEKTLQSLTQDTDTTLCPFYPHATWDSQDDILFIRFRNISEEHIPLIKGLCDTFDLIIPAHPSHETEDLPIVMISRNGTLQAVYVAGFILHTRPQHMLSDYFRYQAGEHRWIYRAKRLFHNVIRRDLQAEDIMRRIFIHTNRNNKKFRELSVITKEYHAQILDILSLYFLPVHIPLLP